MGALGRTDDQLGLHFQKYSQATYQNFWLWRYLRSFLNFLLKRWEGQARCRGSFARSSPVYLPLPWFLSDSLFLSGLRFFCLSFLLRTSEGSSFILDCVVVRFGLRVVEAQGNDILLNGVPLKLLGFNRHDLLDSPALRQRKLPRVWYAPHEAFNDHRWAKDLSLFLSEWLSVSNLGQFM